MAYRGHLEAQNGGKMPIYEYKCGCGEIFDVWQNINDPKLKTSYDIKKNGSNCKCDPKTKIKRLISRSRIQIIERSTMTDRKLYKELDIE